jgi:hypothetical protein
MELLKFEIAQGRGEDKCFVKLVEREARESSKPHRGVTEFRLRCDDEELCASFNAEKNRIIKHCGNKAVALSLMHRAWRDALADSVLDRILAEMERQ